MASATADLVTLIEDNWYRSGGSNSFYCVLDSLLHYLSAGQHKITHNAEHQAFHQQCVQAFLSAYDSLPPCCDIVGDVYMALASYKGKSILGQYFTPSPIARMMAAFNGISQQHVIDKYQATGELTTLSDSSCGSGRLMLAMLEQFYQQGIDALPYLKIVMNDLDVVCVKMTLINFAIQEALHGLRVGHVIITRGDILTYQLEPYAEIIHDMHLPKN